MRVLLLSPNDIPELTRRRRPIAPLFSADLTPFVERSSWRWRKNASFRLKWAAP